MLSALEAVGWDYYPTSSMVLDADTLGPVIEAFEILARAVDRPGELSMLGLQIKLVDLPRQAPGATSPRAALGAVRQLPSPNI